MTRATYKTMPALLATLTPFTHGSAHAIIDSDGVYHVFSYSTEIASRGLGVTYFNELKYSVTTSRLQNIIRHAWSI
jgi:hypothetical protein